MASKAPSISQTYTSPQTDWGDLLEPPHKKVWRGVGKIFTLLAITSGAATLFSYCFFPSKTRTTGALFLLTLGFAASGFALRYFYRRNDGPQKIIQFGSHKHMIKETTPKLVDVSGKITPKELNEWIRYLLQNLGFEEFIKHQGEQIFQLKDRFEEETKKDFREAYRALEERRRSELNNDPALQSIPQKLQAIESELENWKQSRKIEQGERETQEQLNGVLLEIQKVQQKRSEAESTFRSTVDNPQKQVTAWEQQLERLSQLNRFFAQEEINLPVLISERDALIDKIAAENKSIEEKNTAIIDLLLRTKDVNQITDPQTAFTNQWVARAGLETKEKELAKRISQLQALKKEQETLAGLVEPPGIAAAKEIINTADKKRESSLQELNVEKLEALSQMLEEKKIALAKSKSSIKLTHKTEEDAETAKQKLADYLQAIKSDLEEKIQKLEEGRVSLEQMLSNKT